MYQPPAFRVDDVAAMQDVMRRARTANLVTSGPDGLFATPLPLLLLADEGPYGTLLGHVARANPHWRMDSAHESLAIFMGPEAYVSPGWYATKQETGKVVPTWNYLAVHAHGPAEFFDGEAELLDAVQRLTRHHEAARATPWAVTDAPPEFVAAQLRGIVGVRLRITRLEGKRKMSQNRNEADRSGVIAGLRANGEDEVASLVEG